MAYEKVQDLSTDVVVKIGGMDPKTGKAFPTKLEGYYLGSRTVQTDNGAAIIHTFQTPKGNLGAWGTKDLNDKLSQVQPGTMTLITYVEKRKIAGGKTKHVYDVQKDSSNKIATDTADLNLDDEGDEEGYTPAVTLKKASAEEVLNEMKSKYKRN